MSTAIRVGAVPVTSVVRLPSSAFHPRIIFAQLPSTQCELSPKSLLATEAQCDDRTRPCRHGLHERACTDTSPRFPSLQRSRPHRCIAMTRRCCPSQGSFLPKRKAKCRLPHRVANDHRIALSHGFASEQPPGNSSPCHRASLKPGCRAAHIPRAPEQLSRHRIEIRASRPRLPKTSNISPPPPRLLPTIPLIRRRRVPRPPHPSPPAPPHRPRRARRRQTRRAMRTVLLKPELDGAVVLAEDDAGGVFGEVFLAHVCVDGDVEFAGVEVGVFVVAHCA